MIKKGVYAAGLSVLNEDRTLNIEATIAHASQAGADPGLPDHELTLHRATDRDALRHVSQARRWKYSRPSQQGDTGRCTGCSDCGSEKE